MTPALVVLLNLVLSLLLLGVLAAVMRIPFGFVEPGDDERGWRTGGGEQPSGPLTPSDFGSKRWRRGAVLPSSRPGSSGRIARRRPRPGLGNRAEHGGASARSGWRRDTGRV
jgi:hypothetical protein